MEANMQTWSHKYGVLNANSAKKPSCRYVVSIQAAPVNWTSLNNADTFSEVC
jgi:hypothetical protein